MYKRQVLVGINTVLSDDPVLNIRHGVEHLADKPVRIVLDSKLQTPLSANVLNIKYGPAIIYTAKDVYKRQGRGYGSSGPKYVN